MARTYEHHNRDGSVFVAKAREGIVGTLLVVTHDKIPTAGGQLLWDAPYGTRMWYLPRGAEGRMVPISNDKYARAVSRNDALRVALEFFGDSYEDTLKHAEQEGIPVRDCFA